ncbi:MAG TPA: RES domain-containing protein [Verrucomicrobiota bacterium]|nr:RES domain-containing protein [Verrucomicrobiota bacterium]
MPQVFRLVRDRHAGHAYDGEGARRYGGRWNLKGQPMVYTAASRALAVLEMLVNAGWEELVSATWVIVPAAVPDDLLAAVEDSAPLPEDWCRHPAPPALARLGTAWLAGLEGVALSVPSAVLPAERNYLLNPRHPQFRAVMTGSAEPFRFDLRLQPPPR